MLTELSAGLAASIPLTQIGTVSPEGLSAWSELWEEYAETYHELELGTRLLKTGIVYFASGKDTTTLLELPEEERRILSQALGIK